MLQWNAIVCGRIDYGNGQFINNYIPNIVLLVTLECHHFALIVDAHNGLCVASTHFFGLMVCELCEIVYKTHKHTLSVFSIVWISLVPFRSRHYINQKWMELIQIDWYKQLTYVSSWTSQCHSDWVSKVYSTSFMYAFV